MSSKTGYQKLQLRDQILLRPDTYIGSTVTLLTTDPIWIAGNQSFDFRQGRLNDGLLRLVIEVISNAIDNVWRSVEAKDTSKRITPHFIKIDVSPTQVTVWNDGANISTVTHDTEHIPIPELIFGHLLTSSNYDDTEERKTSGKNGIGAKACNLFSKRFQLTIFNREEKILYTQQWTDNMKQRESPILQKKGFPSTIEEGKNGFTSITFEPDFARFGEKQFDNEHLAMIRKLVIDAAMTVSFYKVKVFLNGQMIPIHDVSDYVNFYFPPSTESDDEAQSDSESNHEKEELSIVTDECKVMLRPSLKGEFTQVSFVNGIQTTEGGVHVDAWCEEFFRPLVTRINAKKDKSLHIDIRDIKKHFFLFVFATIDKPKFTNQSKTRLTAPSVKPDIKTSHITKLMKWRFVEKIEESLRIKELATLKKQTERKKGHLRVEKLDDANFAGSKQAADCSLFISEGDSAKTYVVQGMKEGLKQFGGKAGRDFIGVLPIRGKFLNVKNASAQTLMNNKEVKSLIQSLGLQFDLDYSIEDNRKKLRYGRLVLSADSDVDGFHICGLVYNFFQTLFPSLLKNNDFFYFMRVPIIKIEQGGKKADLSFFSQVQANQYIADHHIPKTKVKYFKGLGTAETKDVKQDFGRRIVQLVQDEPSTSLMENVFHKDHTGFRKSWLQTYQPISDAVSVPDYQLEPLQVSDFLNKELIQFSIDDCKRSIPHLLDGFKESHRKVMFAAFKRNLKYSGTAIKVAQFAGYIAEHTGYHHGENNLLDTITKLAQRFVGSNNIPLLYNQGQFGCLDPHTKILMWNGRIKEAKDITIGDQLVGDDGKIRNVLKITSGIDDMFEVSNKHGKYIVNTEHLLTLVFPDNFKIRTKPTGGRVYFEYFDGTTIKSYTVLTKCSKYTKTTDHFNKSTLSLREAFNKVSQEKEKLLKSFSSNTTFDIKVNDFIKLSNTNKSRLLGISNCNVIDWPLQNVPIDPYIFGLWLGDGNSNGLGYTSIDIELLKEFALYLDTINCELVHHSSGNKDHDNYHYTIRRKGSGKLTSIGDSDHNSLNCIGCKTGKISSSICDWKFDKSPQQTITMYTSDGCKRTDLNPWIQLLKKHNLFNNKHIPDCYKYNSPEIRLKLLAGFIDTDGSLKHTNNVYLYEITQSNRVHSNLIYDLEYICKSLGFSTSISLYRNERQTKQGKDMSTLSLIISGNNLEIIPTKLNRKIIPNSIFREKRIGNYSSIKVKPIGKGPFCGWSVDGNERFLLGDFQVTHNSRIELGKDAANGRYIFTKLDFLTRMIFREEDESYLADRVDDGDTVEKEYYIPILPMVLVNPTLAGIGTGWSCNIPGFNPLDLVAWIKAWLTGDNKPAIKPWYRGFKGTIELEGQRITSTGIFQEVKKNTYRITEIPIGKRMLSISKYKEILEDLREKGSVKTIRDNSTEELIDFTITVSSDFTVDAKSLALIDTVSITNMVLFDSTNRIRKYNTVDEILDEYCTKRLDLYQIRRDGDLKKLQHDEQVLHNKIRFIDLILDDTISLKGKDEEVLEAELTQLNFMKVEDKFDYLLSIQVRSMTQKRLDQLISNLEELRKQIRLLNKMTPSQLWTTELKAIEKDLHKLVESSK